jgi:NAD(P)H-nitrite reductase large subunit
MKISKYLVIGNSTAAVAAIEGLRQIDSRYPILLAAKEKSRVYSRPLISHLLAGDIEENSMFLRPPDFYATNNVEARLGVEIEIVNPDKRSARTRAGEELAFEKLLIAVGGRPIVPPIEGFDAFGVFTFTGWDDARAVDEFIKRKESRSTPLRAVVIGAGMIGIKALEALRARGVETAVVEREDRLLPQALGKNASAFVERTLREAGAEIRCGARVQRIRKNERNCAAGVTIEDGRDIPCDLVIMAVGVAPDISLVRNTAIKTERGIIVDQRCMTSVEGIYAAGDVSQPTDSLDGTSRPIPIFVNAFRQGRTAGINMGGGSAEVKNIFSMNSMEIFGMPLITAGLAAASGPDFTVLEKNEPTSGVYKRIVLKNDRIVGTTFIGDVDNAGIFNGLMKEKVDISTIRESLLIQDFGLLSLPADYRKHVVRGEGIEV